jgi:hypothetical protein
MTDERACLESPVLPIVMTVALLIECQSDGCAVNIFPLTSQDMAVSDLARCRWRKRIGGTSVMYRRLGASRSKQRAGEK